MTGFQPVRRPGILPAVARDKRQDARWPHSQGWLCSSAMATFQTPSNSLLKKLIFLLFVLLMLLPPLISASERKQEHEQDKEVRMDAAGVFNRLPMPKS